MPKVKIGESLYLYYQVRGEGPPIVFIHPPALGHKVFMHQEGLAENYRLIFYDLPGHGQSTSGKERLSISSLADSLYKLLNHLGIDAAAVCAFSHGTLIAQEFALKHPDRVTALILCSGYPEVKTLNIKSLAIGGMALAKLHQLPVLARILAKTHRFFKSDEEKIYHYVLKADPQKVYEYIKAGMGYTAAPALHQLAMPVLLVYGSREKMNHRYRKDFEKELAKVETVFVDGAPHELPPRFFQEFNGIIHQFLKRRL